MLLLLLLLLLLMLLLLLLLLMLKPVKMANIEPSERLAEKSFVCMLRANERRYLRPAVLAEEAQTSLIDRWTFEIASRLEAARLWPPVGQSPLVAHEF